jgi:hypothetical protein
MTKKKQKPLPRFGNGLLSDDARADKTGKMHAFGIFTMFWAWDFPCQRNAHAVITLFDLTKQIKVNISIRKKGEKERKLTTFDITTPDYKKNPAPLITNVNLQLSFDSEGDYELIFSIPRNRNKLKIAFRVKQNDWPKFTNAEIKYAKSNPNSISPRRISIQCPKCKRVYNFEESILHKTPDKGVEQFPETGKYKCIESNCTHTLELRDLQGLLRNSLKNEINQLMGKMS